MDLTKDYNILLFGNKGWIGSKVYKLLIDKNIKVNIAESRADDYHSIESEIKKLNNITTMVLVVVATLFISHCWKQRHFVKDIEGGNIKKAIELNQYDS
jgi:UDP-glucose 4-epimerase